MPSDEIVCFGPFIFNPVTGDLVRGERVDTLRSDASLLLATLVRNAGARVTRDEWRESLAVRATLDGNADLDAVARQLAAALGDDIERPRYIEILDDKAVRFLAQVSFGRQSIGEPASSLLSAASTRDSVRGRWMGGAAALLLVTLALVAMVRARESRAPSMMSASPSVAVLLFDDSDTASSGYRAALGAAIAAAPMRDGSRSFAVHGPESTSRYDGNVTPIDTIARALGVSFVLSGTIRRAADGVHVIAQLVRVNDRHHIWVGRMLDTGATGDPHPYIAAQIAKGVTDAVSALR